jgi:hypothetical protein
VDDLAAGGAGLAVGLGEDGSEFHKTSGFEIQDSKGPGFRVPPEVWRRMTEDGPRGGRRGKTKENVLAFFASLREAEGNPQKVGLPPRP